MPHDSFYASRPWQKLRAQVLRKCEGRCGIEGCPEPARHVDHRTSRRQAPARALDPTNLIALCARHHSAKTARVDGGFGHARKDTADPYAGLRVRGCDASGMPLDPKHPWNKR